VSPAGVRRAPVAALVVLSLYAWGVEPSWIEVTVHRVELPLDAPLRIVHLSDLHTSGRGGREARVLSLTRQLHPDVIVLTGDTVANGPSHLPVAEAANVRAVLSELSAPLGVFAVPGNWEYARGLGDPHRLFEGTRVRLLQNEAVELRADLWLAGLDDAWASDPKLAFRAVPTGVAAIALVHSPSSFPDIAPGAALVLAGHSHGGQVRLPFLPPLWTPPGTNGYVAGWYEQGTSRMYVSRGIGTSLLPLRFLCRPEIAVIDLSPPS
jgi:predicted MPP superfamily phosphohydrolase